MKFLKPIALTVFIFVLAAGMSQAQSVIQSYKYRVTAVKKNDNAIKSESNIAEVIPPLSLYIPSAFTPNGDGMNDSFGVSGAAIDGFAFQVFNRWGELMFESKNPMLGWDGKFNELDAPQGVYVYKVLAKAPEGGHIQKNGNVTLVR